MNRLRDLVRSQPKHGFEFPAWLDHLVSVGIVTSDPQVGRRQRFTNVAAYATAANAGHHLAINIVHAFQALAVVHGAGGAKEKLFEVIRPGLQNPAVTPDIVVTIEGLPRLIIDAKYKPPVDVPDRSDVNQMIAYGARYVCEKVMVLMPGVVHKQRQVEIVGKIGAHTLYTGHIDLGTDQIEDEEQTFAKAVAALLDA